MKEAWINKAELYTLLSGSFAYPTKELSEALIEGSYAENLSELLVRNKLKAIPSEIGALSEYSSKNNKEVLSALRLEHTRLFLAGEDTPISLYGESWAAKEKNTQPLLFIGEEARAVEKFMRMCGVGHTEERHEPLDHIAAELEFLKVLCLMRIGEFKAPEGVSVPENAYEDFYEQHFITFASKVGESILAVTKEAMFAAVGAVLKELPSKAF